MTKYKKNYLTHVIARIDLASPVLSIRDSLPKKFTEKILKTFPIKEPQKLVEQQVQFQFNVKEVKNQTLDTKNLWNFHDLNREKTLTIDDSYLYIDFKKYDVATDLEIFKDILNVYQEVFSDIQISRFGLRYINEIGLDLESNPTDWKEYINKDLLGIFSVAENQGEISRAVNILATNHDSVITKFQYGMFNPDYPSVIKKKIYLLDIDTYYQGAQTLEEVLQNINEFRLNAQHYFEKSITQKLKDLMNK